MKPANHGFGLYGRDFGYPGGGLCLSAFLAVENDGRVLAGRMDPEHEATWIDRWAPNVAFYEGERRAGLFEGLRLPATYLEVGEAPTEAARRVFADQLGLPGEPDLGPVEVSSTSKPSRRTPEHEHWDVLFVHRVEGPETIQAPDHWARLEYVDPEAVDPDDFVMLHGDLADLVAP